ncbi:MAG: hypothetical protein IM577_06050 [Chitinophagaceae bacterium]|nr:hypothetical protein [Chitinophagaceae bacterium]MCA6515144.1 hypothetical protein [Chitinophagaceae bacterium]MCE2972829.1 hypothetical protein [Sediminibacterium sp.]
MAQRRRRVWRRISDFSSAKSSAFGGDFEACFSIALSLDADTYSFGWYAIHPHSLLISFERLCGGENHKQMMRIILYIMTILSCRLEKVNSRFFMKISILIVLIILSLHSSSQVKNATNYDELIKFQKEQRSETESIVIWGKFGGTGKFGWNSHRDICPSVLNKREYSGLLSALSFNLFSDSVTTYYLPIKKDAKILSDFKTGDFVKLKIKLYRDCKVYNGRIYFLIEEIF